MGGVLSGVGSIVGDIGGGVAQGAGATSQYQASNPYSYDQLQVDTERQNEIWRNQNSLAQALQDQMAGKGPNPAQLQYQANVQNNIANSQGLISSQRGLNPALAARLGANSASVANQQGALGSALLQQQQQLAATNSLGGLYGQMQQGNQGALGLYNQANLGAAGINAQTSSQNAAIRGQLAGGILNGIGGAASAGMGGGKAHGGRIDGQANVAGDSLKNDTVHTMLSPGEIVIPRSQAQDPEKAKEFIDHLLKSEKKSEGGYGEVLKARRKKKDS